MGERLTPHNPFTPLFHFLMRSFRAVVKGLEKLVPRHFQIAVITLEIAVMHLVVKAAQCQTVFILDQQALKTSVGSGSGQRLVLHMEQDVDRVGSDHPVDQNR